MIECKADLPKLPPGWVWELDEDGYWSARCEELRVSVHLASDPPCDCCAITRQRESGDHRVRHLHGPPVRISVAVMQANGLPWEPSDEPVGDCMSWIR